MTTEPPPPPDDDPFKKKPPEESPSGEPPPPGEGPPFDPTYGNQPPPGTGSPYGATPPPPYGGGDPYGSGGGDLSGGGPYGDDPLAGMPPLADSGKRTLARIIDMILVIIVVWLVTWAFNVNEYDVDSDKINYGRSFGQSLIAAVLFVSYDTVMTVRAGQTLGKKWLHLRVANLDNGATPSVQTSLVRALVLWLPFAFCCACVWTAIAGGWSYFDKPFKQGLHDKAAKTVVVSTG
ncbi:RDD family protein [Streptomyces sp. NBC_00878]|uniref:RDD family protein n=1 Tax=Streptomyces sp. NBC_00878 TaxID=2975854 RepID=UPI00225C131C|nr:RDD family protein [Streptomyces sp. NBC_00878]MCX4908342.1 RDD family protein [Streptomyces sp. NBC_00878]